VSVEEWMPNDPAPDVTVLLQKWAQGDDKAFAECAAAVYPELQRLAHFHLRFERADHTLQSTALVNEAFLRMMGGRPPELQNRDHFVAIASRLMRQILTAYARERRALKRAGGVRIALEDIADVPVTEETGLIELDDALKALARGDERQARIVEMRFFGGLSALDISHVLGISVATVERDWRIAKVWLRREMMRSDSL
jgi:RNA polymerase sigma-70 factor (ECF subfamily)